MNIKSLLLDNQSIKQTILKNTFWLTVAEMVQAGIGFLIVVWLARHFGPVIYGQWAFALSFVALFSVFADFGFTTLTVREIARDKSKTAQYLDNILIMKLILGLITLGLIVLIVQFLGKEPEVVKLVYFLGIYTVINIFATFFHSIFRANEKMQYETACRVIQSLSLFGLVAYFILNKGPILTISYAYIGAALIGVSFSLAFIWRYFSKFFLKIDFKVCKEILSEAWPFGLSFIAISIYYYLGSVMLGIMKSNEEVGWYNAAYTVILFTQVFGVIMTASFFPKLSQKYKESLESLKAVVNKFAKILHIFAWPIAFGGTLLASRILIFFYGKEYLPGTLALQILAWSMAIIYINTTYGEIIKATDRQKLYLIGVGGGAVLNVILNFLLIPLLSLNGAALATLLTEIAVLIFMYIQVNKLISVRLSAYAVIPLCLSIIMGFLIYFYFSNLNIILVIFLGALIYFLLLMVVEFLTYKLHLDFS
jgi:O-antigen/teichoic acid export membrane protein